MIKKSKNKSSNPETIYFYVMSAPWYLQTITKSYYIFLLDSFKHIVCLQHISDTMAANSICMYLEARKSFDSLILYSVKTTAE
jgi:hypothetical protein